MATIPFYSLSMLLVNLTLRLSTIIHRYFNVESMMSSRTYKWLLFHSNTGVILCIMYGILYLLFYFNCESFHFFSDEIYLFLEGTSCGLSCTVVALLFSYVQEVA